MNAPGRSGIPKVIGILMIIFGSLGILFGLIGLGAGNSGFKTFDTMNLVFNLIGLGISVLHLVGGIPACASCTARSVSFTHWRGP